MTERGGQTDAADDLLDHKKIKLRKDTGIPETKTPKEKPKKAERVSILKLFKYSGCCQKVLFFIGLIASAIAGLCAPSVALVFGEVVGIFDPNNTAEEVQEGMIRLF